MMTINEPARPEEEEPDSGAHIQELNSLWRRAHQKRTRVLKRTLLSDHKDASKVDEVLAGLAAHEIAIAEALGDSQVLLAGRLTAFVDAPQSLMTVARAISEVTASRNATTRRAAELLQTAATLRAQRALLPTKHNSPHLRRVA
jgi:hypothetical protein